MKTSPVKTRREVLENIELRPSAEILQEGRVLAKTCKLGPSAFSAATGYTSEAAAKRAAILEDRITQHAHIGFRSVDRTVEGVRQVYEQAAQHGAMVDRFGITLDWSMGYPAAHRKGKPKGTGIILTGADDMARITHAAPAAAHFGDFMLGLPAALENTQAAVAAGVTSIGNMGQYFTFRLPFWDDEVATTETTVAALALIAAQDAEILVHSNLDDGFAALFEDMASSIGMVLIEKYIVEDLIGAPLAHCYGHHFSDPVTRHAFHGALAKVTHTPGSMIFGNTTSYRSTPAGNYASLATYLLADILGQKRFPTGHAINPVPVTENERIPDIDEIVDAQIFAHRLCEHAGAYEPVLDWQQADTISETLVSAGEIFAQNVLSGLEAREFDIRDPAELMLALRRIGPRALETAFGAGDIDQNDPDLGIGRMPKVKASWLTELDDMSRDWLDRNRVGRGEPLLKNLRICLATTDVHEHGKYLFEKAMLPLGAVIIDGGVAVDPNVLIAAAMAERADVIAISTYNGVALRYCLELQEEMRRKKVDLPIIVGGKLNQIPEDTNTGLPVDVSADLRKIGVVPCAGLDDALDFLKSVSE